jgi:hypothetical protein
VARCRRFFSVSSQRRLASRWSAVKVGAVSVLRVFFAVRRAARLSVL